MVASSFGSFEELCDFFEEISEEIMRDDVAKSGVSIMKDILVRDLYSHPESDVYVRTGELLNSVVALYNDNMSNKKRKIVDIQNATSDAFMPSRHPNLFGEGGRNMNAWIPQYIDEGHGGLANFIGINYFDNTWNELDATIDKTIVLGFKKRGIDAYSV